MSAEKKGHDFVAERTKVYNDTGHTSIPKAVTDKLGLEEGDFVGWVGYEDKIMIVKANDDE